jgi:MFS family permease
MVTGYFLLLRDNPNFARLWLAQVVSLLGDWFSAIALSALVSKYSNGSGLAVSALLIARFLPPLFVSPFTGVLVDRFNRKHLLILSDVLRVVTALLLLLANDPSLLWLIYLLMVFQSCLSAIFEPGRSALLPSVVSGDNLLKANTLSNITWSVMLAVGGAVGGLVAALFGTATALLIDASTFALSALILTQVKTRQTEHPQPDPEHKTSRGGFREGLRYVMQNPATAAALFIKLGLSIGNIDAVMIAYGTSLFIIGEDGTGSMGILYSAFGLGSVIGPLILNRFNDSSVRIMRRLIIISFTWVTLGWLLFGFAPTLLLAALALMVRAMGGSATWTYSSTILQISTPDEYLGRVFSLDWAGYYLATTISVLITGILIDTLGHDHIRNIAIGSGIVSIIPLVLWALAVYWLEQRQTVPAPAGD